MFFISVKSIVQAGELDDITPQKTFELATGAGLKFADNWDTDKALARRPFYATRKQK